MKSYRQLMVAASIGVALLSSSAQAITVQEVPNPRVTGGWVSDRADLLTPESEAEINQILSDLEAANGTEMAVVTVADTASFASPKAFSTELFNTWGIGKAEQDNGVMLLVSVGDRRAEVEVGTGLESTLTQARIENLLEKEAVPAFRQGNFDQGIVVTSEALAAQLQGRSMLSLLADRPVIGAIILFWGGVIIFAVVYLLYRRLVPQYSECPQCHKRTLDTKTVDVRGKRPSATKKKKRKVTQVCRDCSYSNTELVTLSQLGAHQTAHNKPRPAWNQ